MRVLHVMAGANEGGAENIMLESVLALAQAGFDQAVAPRGAITNSAWPSSTTAGIRTATADFNRLWPFGTNA